MTYDPEEFRGKHPDEEKADEEFYAEFYGKVQTWQDDWSGQWFATYGDYDLDAPVGTGATEREAIDWLADLMGIEL